MLFYVQIVDQAIAMEVAIKTELPGTVHTYSVAPMVRSAAAVALSAQLGCSSSTDSLTRPGGICSIVGFAVSPPYPSRAEDVLPPLPPSNTGAVVRSPSTSERPPSRSSKNEGLQEKSLIKILTKVFPSELWKCSNANDLKKIQLHML
ncbi:hypothetical protein ACQJBY_017614 [Aegilops geniculata]